MNYVACCAELEKLIVKPGREKSLGLVITIHKWGPGFLLLYQNDWSVPEAEAGIKIGFCPFCGSRLEDGSGKGRGREDRE
jgi:hypothetical protein